MKFGPNCAGKCCICAVNTCLAGNGDDDFSPATKEQIIKRLQKGEFRDHQQYMIDYLTSQYGYIYSGTPGSEKPKWKETIEKEILSATTREALDDAIIKEQRLELLATFLEHGYKTEDIVELYGFSAEEITEVQCQ